MGHRACGMCPGGLAYRGGPGGRLSGRLIMFEGHCFLFTCVFIYIFIRFSFLFVYLIVCKDEVPGLVWIRMQCAILFLLFFFKNSAWYLFLGIV